jgi:hypothetical protein
MEYPFEEYYWQLKRFFPGDPEFSMGNYGDLPYSYVVIAIQKISKLFISELNAYERPIALQTSVIANQNRDPKKQRKPFMPADYAYYVPREDINLPDHAYGSAAMVAIKQGVFPSWALFCYKDLASGSDPGYVPEDPILVSEDAILLHPMPAAGGLGGMLVALESASLQTREFRNLKGEMFLLEVPEIPTKAVAVEGVTLPYQQASRKP